MTSDTNKVRALPSFPAGCDLAKSSLVNPFACRRVTANASPKAIAEVVDEVGAKSRVHASSDVLISMWLSEACAIEDKALPVTEISLFDALFKAGV
jgi:hypothetical protein